MSKSFYSSLSYNKCENILAHRAAIKYSGNFIFRLKDSFFSIKVIDNEYTNSFARSFYGKISKDSEGTLIEGEFRLSTYMKLFIILYYSIILAADILIIYRALFLKDISLRITKDTLFGGLFGLFFMKLIGFAVIKRGIHMSSQNEPIIIHCLKAMFEIKDNEV